MRWVEREAFESPTWEPAKLDIPSGSPAASEGRLRLGTYRPLWASKDVDITPSLQFIRARQIAELSPVDAGALGIGEGDRVEVGNGTRVRAQVRLRQAVPAGSVFLAEGIASDNANVLTGGLVEVHRVGVGLHRAHGRGGPGPARRRGPGRDAAVGAAADPAAGDHMSVLLEVGFYEPWWMQIAKAVAIFFVVFNLVPIALVADRKVLGRFQHRYGPTRVGPFGALQPIADIGKLVFKEQFRPKGANGWLFALAPVISMLTAAATIAIIPFSDVVDIFGTPTGLYGLDPSIGILYAFAFGGIAFYGLMLGGWASSSKYSFLGAMRAAAQLISYEVAQGLSLVGVVMMVGSLSLVDIVNWQQENFWLVGPQLVGFLIFMVAGFAETNRAPFDLAEADAELVGGFNTEYGGGRFAAFFAAEYLNVVVISALFATLFFGGWDVPFWDQPNWIEPIVVIVKTLIGIFWFIWVRATLPRLRYDQLMSFGWKILLPLATLNALVTAILVVVLD